MSSLDEILDNQNVNELIFPGNKTDKFNINNLKNRHLIFSTLTHRVYGCHYKSSKINCLMAIKYINLPYSRRREETEKNMNHLLKEIDNMRSLSYADEVIDFYGLCIHENQALICMELMSCSLHDFYIKVHDSLRNEQIKFPEDILGTIAVRIVDALCYCKSKNIMHRDVKPLNILLKKTGEIKLCDFGESRILKSNKNRGRAF